MPLYEYVCRDCARRFERIARTFNEPAACPHCHSAAVDKQLSTFAMSSSGGPGARETAMAGGGCCGGGGCGCRH